MSHSALFVLGKIFVDWALSLFPQFFVDWALGLFPELPSALSPTD
jgi:hypothetical protein